MALQAKAIKGKIKAVGNIKKITKTMEMVAASKMRKAVDAALGSRDYALAALEILVHLADERDIEHKLLTERAQGKTLLVIVASNKGLCGGYNVNISRQVTGYRKQHANEIIECVTVGKQAERIAKRNKLEIVASLTEFQDFANAEDAHQLISVVLDLFTKDVVYEKVALAYTQFVKPLEYAPKIKKLLPIDTDALYLMITDTIATPEKKEEMRQAKKLYTFEPDEEEVADVVIPELLTAVLFQVLLDAYASEHSSRMVAMQNATENAGAMQDELQLTYNKARQAGITQEIAEISAGANAMK